MRWSMIPMCLSVVLSVACAGYEDSLQMAGSAEEPMASAPMPMEMEEAMDEDMGLMDDVVGGEGACRGPGLDVEVHAT